MYLRALCGEILKKKLTTESTEVFEEWRSFRDSENSQDQDARSREEVLLAGAHVCVALIRGSYDLSLAKLDLAIDAATFALCCHCLHRLT